MSSTGGRGRGSSSGSRGRARASARVAHPRASTRSSATAADPSLSASTSRSSRRRSLDPYPTGAGRDRTSSPDHLEEVASEAGPSRTRDAPPAPASVRVSAIAEESPTATGSPGAPTPTPDKKYDLVVVQQPSVGAAVGMDRMTLGRLPVVPAPVVQLIVRDQDGQEDDVELPYLFCSCVLKQEDGVSPVTISAPEGSHPREAAAFSALLGNLVRNAHRVTDLEGNLVSQFVFEDISVRLKGRYTLEFRLGEATGSRPQSPRLAAVVSDPFDVVQWEEYPGRPAADVLTDISRNLHEQGVPMYIPPLVLSQSAPPPPPSTNPFPDDAEVPIFTTASSHSTSANAPVPPVEAPAGAESDAQPGSMATSSPPPS